MTIAAGRLNKRVALQSPTISQDNDTGATTETWGTVATVWASIEPLSVRDFIASDERQSKVAARITIRYRDDIDATWRVVHKARTYQIVGVLADQDSGIEYLTLAVAEGVNQGGA